MPSEEFVAAPAPSPTTASAKVENNDDGSDLRADVKEKEFPAEWNFSSKAPESQYRPPVEIPAEPIGHGLNRCAYFVCRDLCDEWIELPSVTPHQINVSRRIKKYLTGDLNGVITSYPAFPGTESHYLRALIARISASTNISPRNFHQIGSNREDKEEAFDDADDDDDASLSEFTFMILELLFFPGGSTL